MIYAKKNKVRLIGKGAELLKDLNLIKRKLKEFMPAEMVDNSEEVIAKYEERSAEND